MKCSPKWIRNEPEDDEDGAMEWDTRFFLHFPHLTFSILLMECILSVDATAAGYTSPSIIRCHILGTSQKLLTLALTSSSSSSIEFDTTSRRTSLKTWDDSIFLDFPFAKSRVSSAFVSSPHPRAFHLMKNIGIYAEQWTHLWYIRLLFVPINTVGAYVA